MPTQKRVDEALTPVFAAGGTRLDYGDLGQQWQGGLHPEPNPPCELFGSGVFKPGDLVQIAMVELLPSGLKRSFDLCEIHQPAGMRVD